MIRFVISDVDEFNKVNIKVEKERKNKAQTKVIKHLELLSDEEFNTIRFDRKFDFKSDQSIAEMLKSEEWHEEV